MQVPDRISVLTSELVPLQRGREHEAHSRAQRRGRSELVRLHHAQYLPTGLWATLNARDRHLARILAARSSAENEPVFSHQSAAALLGLPQYHRFGERVHLTNPPGGVSRPSERLVRHRAELESRDVVSVAGVLCTSPDRTLIDLARSGASEDALALADEHLRNRFRVARRVDESRLRDWEEEMAARAAALRGLSGVRSVREVLSLADPRKDSVLESVSHLRLVRLGFEVAVQVPVPGPGSTTYYVDFELLGRRLFGECDGRSKYTGASVLDGEQAKAQVYRDKRRQDWICGSRKYDMIRWGYPDVRSELIFARRLRAFEVPIPKPPRGLR